MCVKSTNEFLEFVLSLSSTALFCGSGSIPHGCRVAIQYSDTAKLSLLALRSGITVASEA